MKTGHASVSVIIAVHNGERTLAACLVALFQNRFPRFEVIVVDDGSTDATREIAAAFPCRLVCGPHAGAAAARNLGVRYSHSDILFFVDADVLVETDTVARVAAIFESRPEVGALFGSFSKRTRPHNFVTVFKNLRHHYTHQTAEEQAATFCGGFGAIYRDTFLAVGGFDPGQRFLEDVEMGYRLRRAGVSIVLVKDLYFTHCKAYTLRSLIWSDLFGRAVPWTRLMLSARVFRNDLNTRWHNVASVPVSYVLALGALLLPPAAVFSASPFPVLVPLVGGSIAFAWLNRRFIAFLAGEHGMRFALKSALLIWLGYLYSGLGMAIGVWQHLTDGDRAMLKRA